MGYKKPDILGKKFNRLTVVSYLGVNKWGAAEWECLCDCGNTTKATSSMLTKGYKKSCGCLHPLNLAGKTFHRLTVIEPAIRRSNNGNIKWRCVCECGEVVEVVGANLVNGNTKSCGCYQKDRYREVRVIKKPYYVRLRYTYSKMLRRCYNPKDKSYYLYGGRGIEVADVWTTSFDSFYAWAISNGYSENLSLDRIDNDGPYSPENCRWATTIEQARNKRNNRFLTFNGVTKLLLEFAEEFNINKATLATRLDRFGWDVERALLTPIRESNRKEKTYFPKTSSKAPEGDAGAPPSSSEPMTPPMRSPSQKAF